jgi:CubicO group peptidase (beta-lactamase class C family)
MDRPDSDRYLEITRIFDRLGVTPQQLFEHKSNTAREAALTSINEINWTVDRPSRAFSPFAFLWRINLDTLNNALQANLNAAGIGYCYMIKKKGKIVHLGASGWAQMPSDGDIRWLFHVPMNIASVSKFVTAIATIRLLRDLKIPVTTPIIGFLPQYWTFGPNVGAITFADLLRHESGLAGRFNPAGGFSPGPVTFATARDEIRRGSSGTGVADYKNINFTLLRVLFATLAGGISPSFSVMPFIPFFPQNLADLQNDNFWDFASLSAYANYVNDVVFTTANLSSRGFDFPENGAKAYATPAATPGWIDGNTSAGAGTSGWYLSVGDLMWVLGAWRRGGSIMGSWRARNMMVNQYGLDGSFPTRAGTVYRKGGRWGASPQVHDSGIFIMPGDAELAIFVNSVPASAPPEPSYLDPIMQMIIDNTEAVFSFSIGP